MNWLIDLIHCLVEQTTKQNWLEYLDIWRINFQVQAFAEAAFSALKDNYGGPFDQPILDSISGFLEAMLTYCKTIYGSIIVVKSRSFINIEYDCL